MGKAPKHRHNLRMLQADSLSCADALNIFVDGYSLKKEDLLEVTFPVMMWTLKQGATRIFKHFIFLKPKTCNNIHCHVDARYRDKNEFVAVNDELIRRG